MIYVAESTACCVADALSPTPGNSIPGPDEAAPGKRKKRKKTYEREEVNEEVSKSETAQPPTNDQPILKKAKKEKPQTDTNGTAPSTGAVFADSTVKSKKSKNMFKQQDKPQSLAKPSLSTDPATTAEVPQLSDFERFLAESSSKHPSRENGIADNEREPPPSVQTNNIGKPKKYEAGVPKVETKAKGKVKAKQSAAESPREHDTGLAADAPSTSGRTTAGSGKGVQLALMLSHLFSVLLHDSPPSARKCQHGCI